MLKIITFFCFYLLLQNIIHKLIHQNLLFNQNKHNFKILQTFKYHLNLKLIFAKIDRVSFLYIKKLNYHSISLIIFKI